MNTCYSMLKALLYIVYTDWSSVLLLLDLFSDLRKECERMAQSVQHVLYSSNSRFLLFSFYLLPAQRNIPTVKLLTIIIGA